MTYLNEDTRKALMTEKQLISLLAYRNAVHSQTIKNWAINNSPMLTAHANLKTICEYFEVSENNILTHE